MIQIPMKTKGPIDRNTLNTLNHGPVHKNSPASAFHTEVSHPANTHPFAPPQTIRQHPIPLLKNPVQKGQKVSIASFPFLHAIKACFGWNVKNSLCDVDVSAFLLGADGKVLGDSWFVFYGQTNSPDHSTKFHTGTSSDNDREYITIDFDRLNPNVKKIVFVLTINEAFEKNLNFGMIKDAYIRILNPKDMSECVSFKMEEYYSNVISMMIGEIYQHNGVWKFGAVGNGVTRDLAGLCALYGVEIAE